MKSLSPVRPVASRVSLRLSDRALDRVAAVERNVGLFGAELVAVMGHVTAPVEVDRCERREPQQPAAHPVVDASVAEQHPVRGLVHQRRELRVGAPHEHERQRPDEQVVDPNGRDDDPDRLRVQQDHGERVARVGYAPQLFAPRWCGSRVGSQAVSGLEVGECLEIGQHRRGGHGTDVTFLAQMTQERKIEAPLDRPLSARSLIGSLLLGMRPPRMPGGRLVEWCSLFGVAEGTARVALSRMVDRGELTASDGVYELAGHLRRRQPAQDWSLAPEPRLWAGAWILGMVEAGARTAAERSALREAGRRLRMVELREGVWGRPDNLPRAAAPAEDWAIADAQCTWWSARPGVDTAARAIRRFEPEVWSARAETLRARLVASTEAVIGGEGPSIADAFVVGAASLAHVRADPLLPAELCGEDWPGDALRAAYRDYQSSFSAAVRDWFRKQ